MKHAIALILLGTIFAAGSVYAADPIVGTWKLDVAKSKFSPGPAPKAATRTYTESAGLYTLDQKVTAADGKDASLPRLQYREGQEVKAEDGISTVAKKVDGNTWDFEIKSEGKTVGRVHRVVSTDGKVLTVHNTGKQGNVPEADNTMVFNKQ